LEGIKELMKINALPFALSGKILNAVQGLKQRFSIVVSFQLLAVNLFS